MSCKDCDKIQEENLKGKNIGYIRVGNADVLVGACDKHFNELQRQIGILPTDVCRIKNIEKKK